MLNYIATFDYDYNGITEIPAIINVTLLRSTKRWLPKGYTSKNGEVLNY